MTNPGAVESRHKIALVWAARRERIIAVRVYYDVSVERGCRVYALNRIEELSTPVTG